MPFELKVSQFVPSRVEGLPDVTEVIVYPDRLEVISEGALLTFHFVDIARWPWPGPLWRLLFRQGWRPRWLPVGERDWFHPPSERFFRFYTTPRIVVFMPDEPERVELRRHPIPSRPGYDAVMVVSIRGTSGNSK